MTQLIWNNVGERYFETGVDRGVFYNSYGTGITWNGLTAVSETLSGGEAIPYYLDGVKYLNVAASEEFGGTIEAFTYPDEFAEYDGSVQMFDGFTINLQQRKSFGLSYRTRIGNDINGENHGYKIHIIYNMLAAPSTKVYSSIGSSSDPLNFSWSFTTTPIFVRSDLQRTAHISIDSTKVSIGMMRAIEAYLYGSSTRSPKLIDLDELIYWFESGGEPFEIHPHTNGLAHLIEGVERDLVSTDIEGINIKLSDSRLTATTPAGLYTLEP